MSLSALSDNPSDRRVAFLDPKSIEPANWAQVDPFDYVGQRFERLKDSIAEFGGNLQPVKVRQSVEPLRSSSDAVGGSGSYELVFGYSRVRACLELGLPVLAMIETVSEAEGLRQFFFEYRSHGCWRPWRLGQTLAIILHRGYFPSIRRASQGLGLCVTEACLLQKLGCMPYSVRAAFGSRNITERQAKKLVDAMAADPTSLVERASRSSIQDCPSSAAVLAKLVGAAR
jgi:ParB family chromosome partitioning protein